MKTTTKDLASALLLGVRIAYKQKLQASKREVLADLLDDMAVALTSLAVKEKNKRFEVYSWIVSSLLEELNDRLDPTQKLGEKRKPSRRLDDDDMEAAMRREAKRKRKDHRP